MLRTLYLGSHITHCLIHYTRLEMQYVHCNQIPDTSKDNMLIIPPLQRKSRLGFMGSGFSRVRYFD